jgi:anthranilate synthase component 2
MLTLIDNYDSFTFNLLQFIGELGVGCHVVRNDKTTPAEVFAQSPEAVIISPGPCDPDRAGICLELIREAPADLPIFGVCLGHQCIGQAFGGEIVRAPQIMHGKLSDISHANSHIFADLDTALTVTRYHSLTVNPASVPECLEVTATTADGVIMGLRHTQRPVYGVQFHPESIASQSGHKILANFLKIAGINSKAAPPAAALNLSSQQ